VLAATRPAAKARILIDIGIPLKVAGPKGQPRGSLRLGLGSWPQTTEGGARACIRPRRTGATDTVVRGCCGRLPAATSPGTANLGDRGSGARGTVHNGQWCTTSPGLVLPGASAGQWPQMPTPGMPPPGSFSTIIESATGNRTLPNNATKASHVAAAPARPCRGAMRFGLSNGGWVIRSNNRAFCPSRFTAPSS